MTTTSVNIEQKELPAGWKWVKLGDVVTEQGKSKVKVKDSLPDGEYPFFTSGTNIYRLDQFLVEGKNIFVSTGGNAIVKRYDGKASYSTDTYCITTNEGYDCDYLYYFLTLKIEEINSNMFIGAGLKHLQKKQFKNLTIPLPPLEEQKRISAILNEQMGTLEKAKKAAEERLEAAKALPAAYLRDVFPDSEEELPAGWKWVNLRDICTVISGQHIASNDYGTEPLGIGYLTGPADFTDLVAAITKWTTVPKVLAESGDILITVKGAGVGKVNMAPKESVAIGRQLMAIRTNGTKADFTYIYRFIGKQFFLFQSKGQGSTVPGLTRGDIETLSIPLPPLEEQKRIATILNERQTAASLAEESIKQELDTIEAMPASLLRKAFNGEL